MVASAMVASLPSPPLYISQQGDGAGANYFYYFLRKLNFNDSKRARSSLVIFVLWGMCILLGPPGCAQVFPYLSPGPLDFFGGMQNNE